MLSSGPPSPTLRAFFLAAVCLSGLLAQSACAQAPSAPAQPPDAAVDTYLIGPNDVLNVFVWREPDYSITVPVRPDGVISTPTVEEMVAAGKTPSQLARDMEAALSVNLRDPKVTIIVENFVGTFSTQIRVLGEVQNPGSFPFRNGMTVFDAVVEAGGLTVFAAGRRGKLMRMRGEGERQDEIDVRVDRLMEKGDMRENLPLQPGDVIVVPGAVF
jgi:polysaccharide export outer membrane protein